MRRTVGRGEWRDEREPSDAFGRAAHDLERDEAAHRMGDQYEFRRRIVEQALREAFDTVVAAIVGDDDLAIGPGVTQGLPHGVGQERSEEHTSELQSLMRISYAVFCLKKKNKT